jgi:predicted transcriptional regulator
MASPPFSVRLSDDLKSRLEKEAEREDRSAGYLVQKAVEEFLDARDFFRSEMEAAIAEADKGVFISGEAMHRWMESWDTDNELSPPEPDIFPENDKP